jgi:hypothetical protein
MISFVTGSFSESAQTKRQRKWLGRGQAKVALKTAESRFGTLGSTTRRQAGITMKNERNYLNGTSFIRGKHGSHFLLPRHGAFSGVVYQWVRLAP